MRLNLKLSLILLVLTIAACNSPQKKEEDLLQWVPQNTSFVLQINDLNDVKNRLVNHPLVKSAPLGNKKLSESIAQVAAKKEVAQLLCITPIGKEKKAVTAIYKSPIDSSYLSLPKTVYSGQAIFSQTSDKGNTYTTFIEGYTLHSDSKIVMENCIRNYQMNERGIYDTGFYEIAKTADQNASINFHFVQNQFPLFKDYFNALPLFPVVDKQWSSVDVSFSEKALEIDGLTKVSDSLGNPLGLFVESNPKKLTLERAIPKSANAFLAFPVDNRLQLEDALKKWVLYKNYPINSTDLSALSAIDEIAVVKMTNSHGIVFHSIDDSTNAGIFIPDATANRYREVAYFKTELAKPIQLLFEILGTSVSIQWVAQHDDFLFFNETEAGIKSMIAKYKEGNTLGKNPSYLQLKEEHLFDASSLLWVGKTAALKSDFKDHPFWNSFDEKELPYIAFQGSIEEGFFHLHLRLHQQMEQERKQSTREVALFSTDAPLISSPQWLKNHRTKGYDVVVQDENNALYLFSNQGKRYWKKQLDSPIVGPIQQVDLYKNGRLQMAFRTKNKWLVLDRNGNVVPPFNKTIKSEEPIQPLAVFDYDQTRDYRFVLAHGKKVTMYNSKGKRVNGFRFNSTKTPIQNTPKHIRIDKKDYILIQEESGKLHILNRTGKPRIQLKEKIRFSDQELYAYLKTFTGTDREGQLIQIDQRGNAVKTQLGLGKQHAITSTTKSLVTLSGNVLTIKGLEISLPFGTYSAPRIFYLNNTIYVSVTDTEAQKVHLFFSDGKTVPGFPVYGNSTADMVNADKDKAVEMIVQSSEKDLSIYKITGQ